MKGLELSERYFNKICIPMITGKFSEYHDRIAAGLVGDGSECFGFDDEISRDHDWGPAVCLWLTTSDDLTIGARLRNELAKLPGEFGGFAAREESVWASGRTGVFEIGTFYKRFIGFDHAPRTLKEWQFVPEENLATATNGKVFTDPLGEFTAFRMQLIQFYPEDIRLKKIAARCMSIAQSGQYNYPRCVRRREYVAARYAEAQFIRDVISMVFLLNRRYKPFYKWMHRAVKELPVLGGAVYDLLTNLVKGEQSETDSVAADKITCIENICQLLVQELRREQLSDSDSSFLLDHGPVIQKKIQDEKLRSLNVWLE